MSASSQTCTCEFPIRGDHFETRENGDRDSNRDAEHMPLHIGPDFGRCLACGLPLPDTKR